MPTHVRSYSKINLGLAIGPPRADGFHGLSTLYQTLALHDFVTLSASAANETRMTLSSNDARVPTDRRNTAWKMVERALAASGLTASVAIHIDKRLPIQGGMGAGSANAAAALLGLERELGLDLPAATRLALAAEVGSDVPLFLVGGSVLGSDRGQIVAPVADVSLDGHTAIPCVIALPAVGVSTPLAFRAWDRRFANPDADQDLHISPVRDTLDELSRTYASALLQPEGSDEANRSGASSILPDPSSTVKHRQGTLANLQGLTREQRHTGLAQDTTSTPATSGFENDLVTLVRTGIENDFEQVVFLEHPLLGEVKTTLMEGAGEPAVYAALSGSGSALFGLYRTSAGAEAAQQRLQHSGVQAIVTSTLARSLYWSSMFAR